MKVGEWNGDNTPLIDYLVHGCDGMEWGQHLRANQCRAVSANYCKGCLAQCINEVVLMILFFLVWFLQSAS